MVTSYLPFYNAIIKNDIINKVDSTYWLYSIENLVVKQDNQDKRYLKVYFFNRYVNENHNLMQLQLAFHGEFITIKDFQPAQQYNDPNIMGFVHEIALTDTSTDLKIVSYIVDGLHITPDGIDLKPFIIDSNTQKVNILNDFHLQEKKPIHMYPTIQSNYWCCCCGIINPSSDNVCPVCGRSLNDNKQLIQIDLEKDVLQNLTKRMLVHDQECIDQQIDLYCEECSNKYGIGKGLLENHIDKAFLHGIQKQLIQAKIKDYITSNIIHFDLSQTFDENLDAFVKPLCNKVITEDLVLSMMDQITAKKQFNDAIQKKRMEDKRKKRNVIIGSTTGGILCVAVIVLAILNQPSKVPPPIADQPVDTIMTSEESKETIKGILNSLKTKDERITAGVYSSFAILDDDIAMVTPIRNNTYDDGQSDVQRWQNIQYISSGQFHTLGLRKDGTIISSKIIKNKEHDVGQTAVQDWKNIKQIAVSTYHSVALKDDGTVVSTKITNGNYDFGQTETSEWKDIVEIAAGYDHTIGLKRDGTVVATKIKNADFDYGEAQIENWSNIISIATGSNHTLGLKSDGTVVAVGYQGDDRCNVSNWHDITAISAGRYHSIGLQKDGKVVATSKIDKDFDFGQNQTQNWSNIIQISAGWYHTLGLRSDGTIVTTNITKQDGNVGQLEISGWQLEDLYGR